MALTPREPLAIVGVGCRLPGGVRSLEDLHALLREGRSGIREVPEDRWDAASLFHPDFHKRGHLQVTRGGFLDDVADFDAGFFGIAPKEALRMDPQQRLILEVSYQAFEDAGLPLDAVAGSRTSVFVGAGSRDYAIVQAERRFIGPTTNTGSAASIVANRVSFLFDLRGPSVAVDTACSSALTAFHLACQTLWDGTADMALAGGVNLILSPEASMGFSKGGYLSPDGECRAFSDDANGYVRSEGAGMVLIVPRSKAREAGMRVHGLIRATVLNQDGRTPGMTMPSGAAQEAMLRQAYAQAGVDPHEVAYVEAHGTGTAVGDPIEANAIGGVLGAGRDPQTPLWLGSIKTNVGHLEPGAGVAGLLKLLLTLRERTVFPNLNFRAPNPDIAFDSLRLRVATELTPLPAGPPLIGGVNSFGFGGTNGHLVLQAPAAAAPAPATGPADATGPHLLLTSARSEPALRELAGALASYLDRSPHDTASVCAALFAQRTAFPYRLAQVGHDRGGLSAGLRAYCEQTGDGGPRTARIPDGQDTQPVVFVFSGQGPQWWAMCRELLEAHPVFRARVLEVERELTALGWLADEGSSLTRELTRDEASSRIGETQIAQPALFALQLGLADVLQAHGVSSGAAAVRRRPRARAPWPPWASPPTPSPSSSPRTTAASSWPPSTAPTP
jgi:acyl transferase domain-containing protein